MFNSISSASGAIASSYAEALKQLSGALTRLGTDKRFQTASEDLGAYLQVNSIQTSKSLMESSKNSISEAKAFLTVAEGFSSELLDSLEDLKTAAFDYGSAAVGSPEQAAALAEFNGIRNSISEILATEYNGAAINIAAITDATYSFQSVRLANGGSLDLEFTVADDALVYTNTAWDTDYTTTAAAIDDEIENVASFAGTVAGYGAQVDSQSSFVDTMIENFESAETSITSINEASELAKYTTGNIRQQAAVAMLAQANSARLSVLNLYT